MTTTFLLTIASLIAYNWYRRAKVAYEKLK